MLVEAVDLRSTDGVLDIERDMLEFVGRFKRATDGTMVVPGEDLEVDATRA